jgi:hypothetical protein
MDEQELVRQTFRHMTPKSVVCHIYADPGGWVATTTRLKIDPLNGFDSHQTASHVAHLWNRAALEIELFQRRVVKLDPAYACVFGAFRTPPHGLTAEIASRTHKDARDLFGAIVDAHPGGRLEKFKAVGSPPAIAHWCGADVKPLSDVMRIMELEWEFNGRRPEPKPDARVRPVHEPETGRSWQSIGELADELGCAAGTLYNHLRGNPVQPLVRGRKFEYGEAPPTPGSIDAMTDEEREAERQFTRAMGFEPEF